MTHQDTGLSLENAAQAYFAGIGPLPQDHRECALLEPPELRRDGGYLFLTINERNRLSISTTIEALIDLMDAYEQDPDLEENGDEHDVSATEGWRPTYRLFETDDDEPEPSGFGDQEGMAEDIEGECSLGWTEHIDQVVARMTHNVWHAEDGEPDLGWTGHGIGVREGEILNDTEANGDELDLNGDEGDYSPSEDGLGYSSGGYDGSGVELAADMIRGLPIAAKRADAYALIGFPLVYQFTS